MNNPFDILNVTPQSTAEEIKKAYHNLAKIYHPDIFQGEKDAAEEKMQELNLAYNELQNSTSFEYYSELYYKSKKSNTYNSSNEAANNTYTEQAKTEPQAQGKSKKKQTYEPQFTDVAEALKEEYEYDQSATPEFNRRKELEFNFSKAPLGNKLSFIFLKTICQTLIIFFFPPIGFFLLKIVSDTIDNHYKFKISYNFQWSFIYFIFMILSIFISSLLLALLALAIGVI